ncbi:MAG: 50S ribosomal protein L32 [Nitrospiraceae bacterium]|nr:50S ribosomal protein L32 [Nitrospiraceae bacterium]
MANPRHRHTRSRRDKRKANWKGEVPHLVACTECSEPRLPHRVCPSCGTYNKRKVLDIVEKAG